MSGNPVDWNIHIPQSSEPLIAELEGGGTIDEMARAANEHGIMITLTFVPRTFDTDEEPTA